MAYDFLNDFDPAGFNHGASPKRQVIFIKIQNYVCLNENEASGNGNGRLSAAFYMRAAARTETQNAAISTKA